jgi:amino acid/peptide:H+ symporter
MAFGHPKGLFPLFFTEMWERLAFYTMVGILLLYATDAERGGLGLRAEVGNEIYGLYLAFVYFTPFIGGMAADRLLGYRRAVALGGLLMGGGLLLMGVPGFTYFVVGLIGLIVGNGFFKPNISAMVGNLYEPGDPKRDAGFNIFYMGINIGAFLATFYVAPLFRNVFGWLWTFRAAGIGVLIAVVILATQWKLLARADRRPERSADDGDDIGFLEILLKILVPAFAVGLAGYFVADWAGWQFMRPSDFGFIVGLIPVLVFFLLLAARAKPEEKPGLYALLPLFVAGGAFFMILHLNGSAMTQWARDDTDRGARGVRAEVVTTLNPYAQQDAVPSYYVNAAEDVPRPDPRSLLVVESEETARMYGQQRMDHSTVARVETLSDARAVEIDDDSNDAWVARAVRVYPDGTVTVNRTTDSHGAPIISVETEVGARPDKRVVFLREIEPGRPVPVFIVDGATYSAIYDGYRERYDHDPTYLAPGEFLPVINPEIYQSWNPIWVIALTPLVVLFFQWRARAGKEVPTAHKLLYGMLLTTASLPIMAFAGYLTDGGTMKVSGLWLAGFYLVVTAGELCLSPVGLSLVTKLSPKRLVGLAMGGWFVATAFGNKFSGFFGGIQHLMDPMYFFLLLAGLAGLVALFIFLVLPKLDRAIRKYGA